MNTKPDITITPTAIARMQTQVLAKNCAGIRLSVKAAGCSGLEYVMDFSDEPDEGDLILSCDQFCLYVDTASYQQALTGLIIDYQQDVLSSGFVFTNPNKKGECGCGESFQV